jgi:hypothetical protein
VECLTSQSPIGPHGMLRELLLHRLRVFEIRVLRGIFGLKRDDVIGGLRKLHNDEFYKLYSSPNIIILMK